ncbi:MAG: hypothetical protein Q4D89_02815 [Arachnia propionica]|nr:hypothetical protein [Arachnia propionica]
MSLLGSIVWFPRFLLPRWYPVMGAFKALPVEEQRTAVAENRSS